MITFDTPPNFANVNKLARQDRTGMSAINITRLGIAKKNQDVIKRSNWETAGFGTVEYRNGKYYPVVKLSTWEFAHRIDGSRPYVPGKGRGYKTYSQAKWAIQKYYPIVDIVKFNLFNYPIFGD